MKVFEEISDVIPSDAHQMPRCSLLHHENHGISDIGKKPDTSWISMDFLRFETAKPLQTFSTSTTLRVRRSVRFLGHHSRRNIRKTTKIKQNPLEKGYKIKQIPLGIELLDPLLVLLLSSCVV